MITNADVSLALAQGRVMGITTTGRKTGRFHQPVAVNVDAQDRILVLESSLLRASGLQ